MKRLFKHIIPATGLVLLFGTTSCTKDLDVTPLDPNMDTSVSYEGLFNKCYATIAMAGNGGANGDCDIDGIDGGTSGYIRQMWNANELPTDEAINGWGDDGIEQSCFNTYDESHPMLNGYFSRLTTSITYCNQYLTEASDYNAQMTAEVRFLRCLHYYLLMDAFGRVPFAETLGDPVIYSRQEIFDWLVKELTENVEPNLAEPKPKKSSDTGYGRVDKAAAWILLSRLYLNAEVYTGAAKWSEAATWAKKVMDSAYQLNTTSVGGWSAYQMLFMGVSAPPLGVLHSSSVQVVLTATCMPTPTILTPPTASLVRYGAVIAHVLNSSRSSSPTWMLLRFLPTRWLLQQATTVPSLMVLAAKSTTSTVQPSRTAMLLPSLSTSRPTVLPATMRPSWTPISSCSARRRLT